MAKQRSSGEGTIIEFKARNCYRAAIYVPSPTGKADRAYHYGTKKECRDWLTQMREEIRRGRPVLDSGITLIEWLRIWLDRYCINIRSSTRMNYTTYIEKQIARHRIAGLPLRSLSTDDLQDFMNFLKKTGKLSGNGGLGNKTIRNIVTMIRTALKQAQGNQLIWTNPADYCQLPKIEQREKQFLTVDEMDRLLRAAEGKRWYIALVLLLMTGCRLGELLALRHDCLRYEDDVWMLDIHHSVKRVANFQAKDGQPKTKLEVSETKTARSYRTIPLLPEVADLVQEHMQMQLQEAAKSYGLYATNPFLVDSGLGGVTDPSNFRKWFKSIVAKSEIGRSIRIHDCRGSWASAGLKAGVPLHYLSSMLGHSGINVTERFYLTLGIEEKNAAIQHLDGMAKQLLTQ